MKRKVIQIADSTQLVSLPRKWAQRYNIKKGDELDILEDGGRIIVSTEEGIDLKNAEIDITGLDRSSILIFIRSIYRRGFDEIKVNFNNSFTEHLRTKEKKKVATIIHDVVNKLIGVEIIKQKERYCIIKDLSASSIKEFDNVLKQIFTLVIDTSNDLVSGLKTGDTMLLESIEEKHDTTTKFVSYCLRLLNKKGYPKFRDTIFLYHIIASLDKIADIFKYSARSAAKNKIKLGSKLGSIADNIKACVELYYKLFYEFDNRKIRKMSEIRDKVIKALGSLASKQGLDKELLIVEDLSYSLEILLDLIEARMALEY